MSDGDEFLSRLFFRLRNSVSPPRRWIDEVEVLDEVGEFRTGPEDGLIYLFVGHSQSKQGVDETVSDLHMRPFFCTFTYRKNE